MLPELKEIARLRKKLGITQQELARLSNLSQSFIAKIESNKIDPSYSSIKKLFSAIYKITITNDIKAKDIMKKRVISVWENDKLKKAVSKMKRFKISQLPVLRGNNVIGLISENNIVEILSSNKAYFDNLKVKDAMEDAPPLITPNTPLMIISELLKHYSIIVVSDKGVIQGVITKSDIIDAITSTK